MRVGIVVYGSLSTTSGGYLYDRKLVEYLRGADVPVEVIELPRRTYPRHLLDNLNPGVWKRLEAASVDVLVQDELCHPSLSWLNGRLDRECPIVSIVHHLRSSESHTIPNTWLYRQIERRYLRTVDGVICGSRTTCRDVDRLAPSHSSVVVYPGTGRFDPAIDATTIESRARESGPLRIMFVGNIVPRKALHTLIQGLARLPDESWLLTVVGDRTTAPDYVDSLERRIDRLGLHERVRFTGRLSDTDVEAALTHGHLLAVPSTYEGFGIAYLEGMGFGLPPLATTAGGASELVTDTENGLLVRPENPEVIARRIRPLIDDRDRLARLGRAARNRYEAHPTWNETMERAHSFLTRITND